MNRQSFQDLVKGVYGRKIAYTNVERITDENVVRVVGECIGTFYWNKPVINYLWNYKKGDQPAFYRTKTIRDDIVNRVVENRAWEIVRFKNGQTYGEPIQFVSLKKDDRINKAVDQLNDYFRAAEKAKKDLISGEWTSAVGTGFKAVQFKNGEVPFRIVTPTPLNTFIIYSKYTEEALLAVQELTSPDGYTYKLCYSDTHEYRIQNSVLIGVQNAYGEYVTSKVHGFGGIPIIEYPNNQDRISDIELVISMLDALNELASDRVDSVDQFVQSFFKFVNCEIDPNLFEEMKKKGAIAVSSNNGGEGKADVDILTQELNQTQTQVFKDDMWDSVLSIEAIPNLHNNNTGGDSQGAIQLRNGWDQAKQATKMKDPFVVSGDNKLAELVINVINRKKGNGTLPLSIMDFEAQVSHSPQDNMQVKAQVLQMLLSCGVHPLIAIKTCGLWADAEKTFLISKDYLDVIYKTIDQIEDAQEQEQKAKDLMAQYEQQQKDMQKVNNLQQDNRV